MIKNKDVIAFTGSFDPFTKGHEAMVKLALTLDYSKVIIVMSDNKDKKALLSKISRLSIISHFIKSNNLIDQVSVEIHDSSTYLVDFVHSLGCNYILRGFRDQNDYEYEDKIKKINSLINKNVETVILKSPEEVNFISSSVVKSIVGYLGFEKTLVKMVNKVAYEKLVSSYYGPLLVRKGLDNDKINLILKHYGEPHRVYHGVGHVLDLIEKLDLFNLDEIKKSIIIKAILYHDIIYNPLSSTNEEDSVKLYLNANSSPHNERVSKLIMATKSHAECLVGEDPLLDIFLDLDLSILGEDKLKFQIYEDSIRAEYSMVPDDIYSQKRNEIMKKLKGSYRTEIGQKLWNQNRSTNLEKYK